MKVENPQFDKFGELIHCIECPFSEDVAICLIWTKDHQECPTKDNYDEACKFAEETTK